MPSVSWQWQKLGEGASRWTFPAKVKGGKFKRWKEGTDLVVKVIKKSAWDKGVRITKADINGQELTLQYARAFNKEQKPTKPIHVRVGELDTVDSDKLENGVRRMVKGEQMLLEQRIFGEYEKFNSNTGWSAGLGLLPDFFSHWSWVHSGEKLLICDLQGHKGRPGGLTKYANAEEPRVNLEEEYYLFTDPAVMSKSRSYGCTDLGFDGICNWFSHHVCNSMCKQAGIQNKRPGRQLRRACRRRSTYSNEF